MEHPIKHKMSYTGHEQSRGTLKYRCPAVHEGWNCPSASRCNKDKPYGKTVRLKQATDLRRFPPVPRATRQFEKLYKTRTAVERVNARLKLFWGADDGNITGARRFHAFVGVVMVAHAAFATILAAAPRQGTKTVGKLGTLHLGKVQKALREKLQL
ncbi:MAG: transposase [Phycisphaerae bacterium]